MILAKRCSLNSRQLQWLIFGDDDKDSFYKQYLHSGVLCIFKSGYMLFSLSPFPRRQTLITVKIFKKLKADLKTLRKYSVLNFNRLRSFVNFITPEDHILKFIIFQSC